MLNIDDHLSPNEVCRMMQKLPIRVVAEMYHVSARTLRFYEETGILQSHRRAGSRYREYDAEQIRQLEIILLLRRLSFSVHEITNLLDGDDLCFRDILNRRISQSDEQLLQLRETNQLLRKLSSELAAKSLSEIKISEILSDFIYLTKQTERMNLMSRENELYRIAIGESLTAGLINEMDGNLLNKIKALRADFSIEGSKPLPIIRIYDTEDIPPTQVFIVWEGKEVWRKDFAEQKNIGVSDEIIAQLKEIHSK